MAKLRPKYQTREAIQWTGNNIVTVQNFVGTRTLDLKGTFVIPNFDLASNWIPKSSAKQYAVWDGGTWIEVDAGDWITPNLWSGGFEVLKEDTVTDDYDVL